MNSQSWLMRSLIIFKVLKDSFQMINFETLAAFILLLPLITNKPIYRCSKAGPRIFHYALHILNFLNHLFYPQITSLGKFSISQINIEELREQRINICRVLVSRGGGTFFRTIGGGRGGHTPRTILFYFYQISLSRRGLTSQVRFRECTLVTNREGVVFLVGNPSKFGAPP